jgi:magnesium-transporting ATPase (P-type)
MCLPAGLPACLPAFFLFPGSHKTLNPKEIVVGDVLCLKGGDQAFADALLFDNDERNGVSMDEAALTGESELVKKMAAGKDPFLLSSTVQTAKDKARAASNGGKGVFAEGAREGTRSPLIGHVLRPQGARPVDSQGLTRTHSPLARAPTPPDTRAHRCARRTATRRTARAS